ncbi:MAG: hypothetical protein ACOY90_00260 [Candidatus Zhuqueibacterota bacterium]
MKPTPHENKIITNFLPGKISMDGFLGTDTRHVHDIIADDNLILERLGVTHEQIADRLQFFINEGKKAIEGEASVNHYRVKTIWSRGMLACPFGEPRLHHKIVTTVINTKLGQEIVYSQLNVHMIRDHGFFEGKGAKFRVEPERVVRVLELK